MKKRKLTKRTVKRIMFTILTLFILCAIMTLVGCKSGESLIGNKTEFSGDTKSGEILENDYISGEVKNADEASSGDDFLNVENDINESYEYNESGKIIIAMYHKFADVESDEWTRSYENFYGDLKYLYEHNYRTISLNDYLNNNIKVPVGCTPIILTFDDGLKSQFNLIKDESGELIVNPKSAVGIMEKFYSEYPDFGLNGTFFVNGTGFFQGAGTNSERLNYLIEKGFEIGNHTNTHVNFSKASLTTIEKEVGSVASLVRKLTNGYEITALALPYGISSKDYKANIAKGEYSGESYENKVILLVGAEPAKSPNSESLNLLSLPRVRARGGNKAVDCDLYYWLDKMEKNPSMKYERIK